MTILKQLERDAIAEAEYVAWCEQFEEPVTEADLDAMAAAMASPAVVADIHDRAARATNAEIEDAAALLATMTKADLMETARLMGFGHLRLSAKALAARLLHIIRDRRGIAQRCEY